MASSSSSLKRSVDDTEASKENIPLNKRMHLERTPFQLKIIDMFNDVNLIAPTELLGKGICY